MSCAKGLVSVQFYNSEVVNLIYQASLLLNKLFLLTGVPEAAKENKGRKGNSKNSPKTENYWKKLRVCSNSISNSAVVKQLAVPQFYHPLHFIPAGKLILSGNSCHVDKWPCEELRRKHNEWCRFRSLWTTWWVATSYMKLPQIVPFIICNMNNAICGAEWS